MIFRRLRQRRHRVQLTGLVERIAARSQHSVWLRVRGRVLAMTPSAGRGLHPGASGGGDRA